MDIQLRQLEKESDPWLFFRFEVLTFFITEV